MEKNKTPLELLRESFEFDDNAENEPITDQDIKEVLERMAKIFRKGDN